MIFLNLPPTLFVKRAFFVFIRVFSCKIARLNPPSFICYFFESSVLIFHITGTVSGIDKCNLETLNFSGKLPWHFILFEKHTCCFVQNLSSFLDLFLTHSEILFQLILYKDNAVNVMTNSIYTPRVQLFQLEFWGFSYLVKKCSENLNRSNFSTWVSFLISIYG